MMLSSFILMRTFWNYLIKAILSSLIYLVTLVNPTSSCYFIVQALVLLIDSVFIETTTYLDLKKALVLSKNLLMICNLTCLTSSVIAFLWCLDKSLRRLPNFLLNFQWFLKEQEVNLVKAIIWDFHFDFADDSQNLWLCLIWVKVLY
jgi:hypothetical protein